MFDEIQQYQIYYSMKNTMYLTQLALKLLYLSHSIGTSKGRYQTKILYRRTVILPNEHGNRKAMTGKRSNNFAKSKYIRNLQIDNILTMHTKKYYVYLHFLDGKLVYVGKGKNHRMTSDTRVPKHQYLIKQGLIETMILRTFESEDMALAYERKGINFFREKVYNLFNVQ